MLAKNKIKILHLEDQASDVEQIGRVLSKAGIECDIRPVKTRTAYVKALADFSPEIIISDHNLPAFDSLEALQLLRSSKLTIPFILVTGTVSEEFAVEAMRGGADDYLLKDRLHRLPNAVVTALKKYQSGKEQVEANLRIQESEAKYRSFFENSMDGILITIADGEILAANPAACSMFRMTEQEICDAGRFGLVDMSDPRVMELVNDRQRTGQARGELTFIRRDGTRFRGEISASTFVYSNDLERTSMIIRDVSERRIAEERIAVASSALHRTLGDLKKVMDSSMDMICAVNEAGDFIQVSAASKTILGYEPDELIGRHVFSFVYPDDLAKTQESAQHVMNGNLLNGFENRYVHKNGSVVTLAWSARWDGEDKIRYGVARDVTERNKAEEKIKRSDTLLRNIDANSLDVICTIDEKGRFLHVSAASSVVWGYHPDELIGRKFIDFVYKEDISITDIEDRSIKEGNSVTTFENRYVRKDGSIVPILWSSKWEETEKVIYCIAKDATDLKKAEKLIASERKRLSDLFMNAPVSMCILNGKDHVFELANPMYMQVAGKYDLVGKMGREAFPELEEQGLLDVLDNIYDTGIPFKAAEMEIKICRAGDDHLTTIYQNILQQPYRDVDGQVAGIFYFGVDVTEQVLARKKIEDAEKAVAAERKRLSQLITNAPVTMCILKGEDHTFELVNPVFIDLFGKRDYINRNARSVFPEIEGQGFFEILDGVYSTGTSYSVSETVVRIDRDGSRKLTDIYLNLLFQPYFDANGKVNGVFYFGVDVTEQVLSRKKIEESEQRYRQIVQTAQEGMWVVDESDITTFVNNKMSELFEYSVDEMIGKHIYTFMDDEGKKIAAGLMEKRRNGLSGQGHFKYISKTGREIWTNVSANPLFRNDGTYAGSLAMITDITEQKKIEAENKKLSDIASLTVNAVIVADADGRITWVNKGFERITEFTFDEVVGKKPGHLLRGPNTDLATSVLMGECARKGLGFRVEILNYSKSGRQYWLDIEARPMHDSQNRLSGFMAIEQDITERKKFEATLVRRDQQLTIAAQISKLGYWEYDVMNDLFTFNDQFYDIFKTDAGTVGGYTMNSASYTENFVHPDDRAIISKSVVDAIKSADSDFNFTAEHRIIYANGEIGHISVHFRIVKDESGRTVKNFGVNQDITERKKVELERLALIESLQRRNQDLQQFSYIVSHNLRAPIAKILGLASIMNESAEENIFFLEKLKEEASHLDSVVKDINTVVSARKSSKEKMELIVFKSQLGVIKQLLDDDIVSSGAIISQDFSGAPRVLIIKSYLHSIFYNLISNALKYRRPEVQLRIEVKSVQVEKYICLSIQDNGEGIDIEKNGSKVFGLYKRFHTGSVTGKGIGLNLVKTHAESLGGYVEVESQLDVGTTFKVYIPIINEVTKSE